MGFVRIMKRGGDDYYEYKDALKEGKKHLKAAMTAFETICELTEEMEDEYSERGGMSRREEYDEKDGMRERGAMRRMR